MTELTEREHEILLYIWDFLEENRFPPTVREIGSAVGLNSPATVHGHLRTLEREGWISRVPGSPRAMRLLRTPAA